MWFITVFEKVESNCGGWPEFGCSRTWGFYEDRGTAVQALHENWIDMHETCYDYAVIEKYAEGISHYEFDSRQWFKFDQEREGYFESDEPECVKHWCGFALG